MWIPKWCWAFVPNPSLDDAYMNLSREWNYEIQQPSVNWENLKKLAIALSKLFGYSELRLVEAIKTQNRKNLWFLH